MKKYKVSVTYGIWIAMYILAVLLSLANHVQGVGLILMQIYSVVFFIPGVILAVGLIVGETAALIFTAGTAAQLAGLSTSGRTLAVHMYALWNEGLHMEADYAAGVVLLILVVGINAAAAAVARRYSHGKGSHL